MSESTVVQDSNMIFHKVSDSIRQTQEMDASKELRSKEAVAFVAVNPILRMFAILKCDRPEIVTQTIDLKAENNGYSGTVSYSVSSFHEGGKKIVTIPVTFKESALELPDPIVVESLLKSAEGLNRKVEANLRREVDELVALHASPLEVKANLEKVASAGPHQADVVSPVIRIDKTWLPADLKVGELLFIGGSKYRIVSGDEGKLSSDSDGSFFTLSLVHETAYFPDEKAKNVIY